MSEAPSSASSGACHEVSASREAPSLQRPAPRPGDDRPGSRRPINGHQIAIERARLAEMGRARAVFDEPFEDSARTQTSSRRDRGCRLPTLTLPHRGGGM